MRHRRSHRRLELGYKVDPSLQEQQVEHEIDKSLAALGRVLDQVERGPTIRQDATKLTIEIGAPRRQRRDRLDNERGFRGPIVAMVGDDPHPARI
jgi:hypothetical protein